MTISSSRGVEFTVQELVTLAHQRVGLTSVHLRPNTQELAYAKKELELILDSLARRGLHSHAMTFETITLVAGTREYTMDAATQQVLGDAMLIPEGQDPSAAEGETHLRQVRRQEWHQVAGKASSGRPSLFYVDRTATTPSVILWPTPANADSVRFHVQRHLADVQDSTATLELQTYWHDYLVAELAHVLAQANNLPLQRTSYFKSEAEQKFREARRHAAQSPPQRMSLHHPTPWSR